MKIVTWNINGFRGMMQRNLLAAFSALDADVYCLQETRMQTGEGGLDMPGYQQYLNCAERPGYAGTAVLTMPQPEAAYSGIGLETFDVEGRLITLDMGDFYLLNAYSPHAAPDLSRLAERVQWDAALRSLVYALDAQKPVVLCGDLNAAYNDADLTGTGQGMQLPGYTREERAGLTALLQSGLVDAYRRFHPDEKAGAYAYRKGLKAVGMDYFLVSARLMERVKACDIHPRLKGSDHWPMSLVID